MKTVEAIDTASRLANIFCTSVCACKCMVPLVWRGFKLSLVLTDWPLLDANQLQSLALPQWMI